MKPALTLLLFGCVCARGQELCRNGLFADDQSGLRVARITAGEALSFFQDSKPGCPEKGAECRGTVTAAPGGEVLVSKFHNGFACVWQSHDAVGWIPAARLDFSPAFDSHPPLSAWAGDWTFDSHPPLSAWAGDWKFFDDHLVISVAAEARLRVSGHAFWRGIAATHLGQVQGDAAPAGNHLMLRQGNCELRMTLMAGRLVASDNRQCGGMNVTFTGVYELSHPPFDAQAASTLRYGRNPDGQDTVEISNTAWQLAQTGNGRRLILRKTHTEKNVIDDVGDDAEITIEAWPLGVNPREKPLYRVTSDGEDAEVMDNALLVVDRTRVYHLESGRHFFDTTAPLLSFSITPVEQTIRYAGLQISPDDSTDQRLKAQGVVGVLTYASADRVMREVLITSDSAERAAVLHSLADTTFDLAAPGSAIRIAITPFQRPATLITIPVVNDDLDLAHARVPAGLHVAAWKR